VNDETCGECGPAESPRQACLRACAAHGDAASSCATACSG
jgi:hypothetical protein